VKGGPGDAEAAALFAPGAPRRSDFFRDIAGSQYHRLTQERACPGRLPFEALMAVFDKAILKVENRRIELSFAAGAGVAIDAALRQTGLAGSPLAEVDLPSSWSGVLGGHIDPELLAGAKVQTIVVGQKWKIITQAPEDSNEIPPVFFVERDANGDVNLRAEAQTFELPAQSFAIQILGSLKIKENGSSDPAAPDIVVFSGGFFLRITPERFEIFITAYAAIPVLGLEGQATGLAIIDARLSGPGIPGIALFFDLQLSVGGGGEGGGGALPAQTLLEEPDGIAAPVSWQPLPDSVSPPRESSGKNSPTVDL